MTKLLTHASRIAPGLFVLALFTTAHAQAPAAAPVDFQVDTKASTLTYHVVHKLHKIDSTSKNVQGRARVMPDGKAQVVVKCSVESFDSGNSNRDAHMKETVQAARYPTVELKATCEGLVLPASYPATMDKTFKAKINFHGTDQTLDVPVKLLFESEKRVKAATTLKLSIESFKIERPSLMFVKVEDQLVIDVAVEFQR